MTYLILAVGLVLVTVAVFALGWQGCLHWTDHATRLADPAPLPAEFVRLPRHNPPHDPAACLRCRYWARQLPRAGYFQGAADPGFELARSYGPFPVNTGPLPLLSELSATWDVIERQQRGWS